MVKEEWRNIDDMPYQVSNIGQVRSTDRTILGGRFYGKRYLNQCLIKPRIDKYGYKCVHLYKNGKAYGKRVHRLVAEAFLPNQNNYPIVNHKDEDKLNNSANNLEWCSVYYNNHYGNGYNGRMKQYRCKVIAISDNDAIVYNSISEAAKKINGNRNTISRLCRTSNKREYKGYTWYMLKDKKIVEVTTKK